MLKINEQKISSHFDHFHFANGSVFRKGIVHLISSVLKGFCVNHIWNNEGVEFFESFYLTSIFTSFIYQRFVSRNCYILEVKNGKNNKTEVKWWAERLRHENGVYSHARVYFWFSFHNNNNNNKYWNRTKECWYIFGL